MSQLTSSPRTTMPSRKYGVIPRLGVTGTLQAPGVYPDVAEIPKSRLVEAFGLGEGVAKLVGTAGAIAEEDRYKIEQANKGLVEKHVPGFLANVLTKIADGTIEVGDYGDDPVEAAGNMVDAALLEPDGTSRFGETYLEVFRKRAEPQIIAGLFLKKKENEGVIERDAAENMAYSIAGGLGEEEAWEGFESLLEQDRNIGKTRSEVFATDLEPRMKAAIQNLDKEPFLRLNAVLEKISPGASALKAREYQKKEATFNIKVEKQSREDANKRITNVMLTLGPDEAEKLLHIVKDPEQALVLRKRINAYRISLDEESKRAGGEFLEWVERFGGAGTVGQFRQAMEDYGGFSPEEKYRQETGFVRKQIKNLAGQGLHDSAQRITELGKLLPTSDAGFVATEKINARKAFENNFMERLLYAVFTGTVGPGVAVKALTDAMKRGSIDPENYKGHIKSLVGETVARTVADNEMEAIEAGMTQISDRESPAPQPITVAEGSAMLWLLNNGAIAGSKSKLGGVTYRSVERPDVVAYMSALTRNVPGPIATQITKSFSSRNSDHIEAAGHTLLAICAQSPFLCEAVISKMPEHVALMAGTFINRANDGEVSVIGSKGYSSDVQRLARSVAEMDPVTSDKSSKDFGRASMWGGKTKTEDILGSDLIRSAIMHTLKTGFLGYQDGYRPTLNPLWLSDNLYEWSDGKWGGIDIDMVDNLPREVSQWFIKQADTAYRERTSSGDNEVDAARNAMFLATARTFAEFPPFVWNGEVTLQRGIPADHEFQGHVEALLQEEIGKGNIADKSMLHYTSQYRPKYSSDAGGYFLVSTSDSNDQLPGFFFEVRSAGEVEKAAKEALREATMASKEAWEAARELERGAIDWHDYSRLFTRWRQASIWFTPAFSYLEPNFFDPNMLPPKPKDKPPIPWWLRVDAGGRRRFPPEGGVSDVDVIRPSEAASIPYPDRGSRPMPANGSARLIKQ